MSYSTQSDLLKMIEEAVLVSLTDDSGAGAVDEDVIDRAISDADGEINGYVGSRHTVPLSTVPDIIRKCSVDIAVKNLYQRRSNVPEDRADAYKQAVKFLEKVAEGKISLGTDDPDGSPPDDGARTHDDNPERIFTRDDLDSF